MTGTVDPQSAAERYNEQYWLARKDTIYLHVARQICLKYGGRANSVIDIGSNATPTLEWHRASASRLVSLDLRNPYVAAGVESVRQNFFDFDAGARFDLATCFQVLEHVKDPRRFAQKILELSRVAVVSVPYKWPKGRSKYHLHDPVDEQKMLQWFGREPVFRYVAKELNGIRRMIDVYDQDAGQPLLVTPAAAGAANGTATGAQA
jgi:SAM-dependent methyltransferase